MPLVTLPTVLKASLPLLASLALLTACSKDNPPSATPTTEPPTAIAEPTVTPSPVPTPFGARTDCPPTWTYYNDPLDHFSFCYPPDVKFVTYSAGRDEAVTVYPKVYMAVGHYAVIFDWRFAQQNFCFSDLGYFRFRMSSQEIAGAVVETCITESYSDEAMTELRNRAITAQVRVSTGGVLHVEVHASGKPITVAESRAFAILATLVVR